MLHIVDIAPLNPEDDPVANARAIVQELEKYSENLSQKPRWLVLNKLDLIPEEEREKTVAAFLDAYAPPADTPVFVVSAINGEGCRPLIFKLNDALLSMKKTTPYEAPVEDTIFDE